MGFRNKASGLRVCELPWATDQKDKNPNGVLASKQCMLHIATPLGLWFRRFLLTQGSSWLATLGFRTQSLGIGRFSKSDLRPESPGEGDLTLTVSSRIDRSSIESI